jgi:UDP-glucose 4-epimerase
LNRLSPSRVLVTGSTGFIGSRLSEQLVSDGCQVYGLCRPASGSLAAGVTRCEVAPDHTGALARLIGDLRPDTIFHIAGYTSAARDLSAVVPSFQANLASTVHLLTAAAETGCRRIVLAGSLEEPQALDAAPSSPYAASKAAATTYARMFWQLFRTPVTVARIYMVYGPAQRDLKKLIPYTILSLLQETRPRLTSGTRQVDWVFVDDVVRGLIEMSKAEGVEGTTVDLGTGVATSVRDVVETIASLMESETRPTFGDVPDRPDEQLRVADVARTEALLGWKPSTALREGLMQTIAYYRDVIWRKS